MDEVFKAINDPSRRLLLDALFAEDGQTLGALCEYLPGMTRYGVMNHLRILEDARLISTHKQGRSKYHYLNPVPIREIHDRWISKYAELRVGALVDLKARVEQGAKTMERPAYIYRAYINATADDVWRAITDPDLTEQYFYGTRVESDWEVGGAMNYSYPDGRQASTGQIIAIDAPKRLEFSFTALWDDELAAEGPAREIWSLAEVNGMTELTIELFEVGAESKTFQDFSQGFPYIVSGLKSLVETGAALPAPY